ncbi:MAG: lysophospholipase [Firmicutes bacterium]|nr:lysophospholipase [Bacillota bacterium]
MIELKTMTIESAADGLPLSILYAEAENPKGIVQICHGMVEHKERYENFVKYLAEQGYHAYIHDMRGHGASIRSKEDLGYFYKGDPLNCITDLKTINDYLHETYPELPVYLFGHSMGSLEVRTYCKKYDDTISGLIVCGSPSYNSATPLGHLMVKAIGLVRGKRFRSKMLNNIALGSYNEPFLQEGPSPSNWLSVNRENVADYDRDPLCGYIFTINGFNVLMTLMKEVYTEKGWACKNPDLPVLFISGEDDPCRAGDKGFAHAVDSMKKAGYANVDSKLYPGLRHEILREAPVQALAVMKDVVDTLEKWQNA